MPGYSTPARGGSVNPSLPSRPTPTEPIQGNLVGAAPAVNFSISVPASNYHTLRDTDNVYVGSCGYYVNWAANQVKINYNNKTYLIGTDGNDSFDVNYYSAYTGAPYFFNLGLISNFLAGGGNDLSSVSYTLTDNVERLELSCSTVISGASNALDNIILGNDAVNTPFGVAESRPVLQANDAAASNLKCNTS